MTQTQYFAGQVLLAMPGISDRRFETAIIYLHEHNAEGAMGFVLNQPAEDITLADILESLDMPDASENSAAPVFIGGPVDTGRGFVLHDSSYKSDTTIFSPNGEIGVTATLDVLEVISSRHPLENAITLLGYSGWGPGQLENELQENVWLVCPFNLDLIFTITAEKKYQAAMTLMGIDPGLLSSDQGSA
ncbi:MAG: YqgE/AlgH family protein [Parvibaculales bacterium]